jgi:ABC-type oligopeptide transport system, periplasmic component
MVILVVYSNKGRGVSKFAALIIVVVLVAAVAVGVGFGLRHQPSAASTTSSSTSTSSSPTTSTTVSSSTTSVSAVTIAPLNTSVLVDDSPTYSPDSLDPASAFVSTDGTVLTNVFQELVEYNGTDFLHVVPVLASSYNISANSETYTFTLRHNITFSNGDPVNAFTVWFSFVRELYEGQAVGIANYAELTVNLSTVSQTGLDLPWGLRHAIQSVTGLPAVSDVNTTISVLNNMLSNFNPNNLTQVRIMEYPDQAYVVLGEYTFAIRLLKPYNYLLLDIANWWGAIVDPRYVDAHGGVQANHVNQFFSSNGGPGTGPYMVKSISTGFSYIVLQANPHYWANGQSGVPIVAQPPRIPVVIINYGATQNDVLEGFDTNRVQIAYTPIPSFNQLYSSYMYRSSVPFKDIFSDYGFQPLETGFQMNTQKFPTNITDFRLAVVHAVNLTQILDTLYVFNGSVLGQLYLGPVSPQFPTIYNPGHLPLYSYNVSLAEYYLNISGWEGGFHVVTPSGTILGNPSAPLLQPLTIYTIAPESPFESTENLIIQQDLEQIGVSVSIQPVTAAVYTTWSTPQSTPNFFTPVYWVPDWPDPIFQELVAFITPLDSMGDWMNISWVNQVAEQLPFVTNSTQLIQEVSELYNVTYWYAPFIWLPNSASYLFIQPYVHGVMYNEFVYYWYNTMYYQPYT